MRNFTPGMTGIQQAIEAKKIHKEMKEMREAVMEAEAIAAVMKNKKGLK